MPPRNPFSPEAVERESARDAEGAAEQERGAGRGPAPGAIARLLGAPQRWSEADLDEIELLEPTPAAESLVEIIDAQLRGVPEERILARACLIAGLLRAEAVLPALVRVATSDRASESACDAALDAIFVMDMDRATIGPLRETLLDLRADLERLLQGGDAARARSVAVRLGRAMQLLKEVCPAGEEREALLPSSWFPRGREGAQAGAGLLR